MVNKIVLGLDGVNVQRIFYEELLQGFEFKSSRIKEEGKCNSLHVMLLHLFHVFKDFKHRSGSQKLLNPDEEVTIAQQVGFCAAEFWRLFGCRNLDENE
ncbi:hypothetical protein E3N88_32768 [Mikania micrantha]|uniref:Uncharacterized protein n=1 Tax=Mikania micrantha TaxID=192012 RepID=A0A5N6MC05_9ASTR|nr:hypothetical protein E3N88_32768 [Mikania micrantha]